jgi:hypothetical protein
LIIEEEEEEEEEEHPFWVPNNASLDIKMEGIKRAN